MLLSTSVFAALVRYLSQRMDYEIAAVVVKVDHM